MKKQKRIALILLLLSFAMAFSQEQEVVVAAGQVHSGNINTIDADITVLPGARVTGRVRSTNGDIYVEENARVQKIINTNGDIFLDSGVRVDQKVQNTYGDIRVKDTGTLYGNVLNEYGDIRINGSYLNQHVKNRHGEIILTGNTHVRRNVVILNRHGNTESVNPIRIYLGDGVVIDGNVTAQRDADMVELEMYNSDVNGNIAHVEVIDGGGGDDDDDEEPDECSGIASWQTGTVYNEGDIVSYDNHRWMASWWTQNQAPGTTGNNGVWQDMGACELNLSQCGGRQIWTPSFIFVRNTECYYDGRAYRAKWYVRGGSEPQNNNAWRFIGFCED